jgi:hypothetical protein
MISHTRRLSLAAALVVLAGPAAAQTWIYEPSGAARAYYEPRVYQSRAYQPVIAEPFAAAPVQRTIINRTVIPQGHGRGPIVKERIVSETVAPGPVVRERVVTRPVIAESYAYAPVVRERVITRPVAVNDYAYSGYAYAPVVRERVVSRALVDYPVRATEAYAMAPAVTVTTAPAATTMPSYRYINNRLLLVDPVTGAVVGEVRDYR